MKTIKVWVGTGYVGSLVKDTIEVEDDATEEEIDEMYQQWIWNVINAGWSEV